jgi:glutaminase
VNTITRIITEVHEKLRHGDEGSPADYIPELALVDPKLFGIALTTPDGHTHCVGDSDQAFTIQSVSKAFVYGLVLDAVGAEATERRVDLEPSGDAFNEISLDPVSSKPMNAMINAGAIAVTGLIPGEGVEERFAWLCERMSAFAGRPLGFDEAVYRSERDTGHRNRAIAHLLRNGGILGDNVEEDLDLYFRQCSLLVTCTDLAVMGSTLANGGVNPVTQTRVISEPSVERVLSVMCSSGMYNSSGTWITRVGLPAKSGVGGGVVAVLPGQLSVAVFSPRLDIQGNSVRGIQAFEELSQRFNLHLFNTPALADQVVRRSYRLSDSGSTRRWGPEHRAYLARTATNVAVMEIQGDLFFASVERLSRAIDQNASARTLILDCSRVGLIDRPSRQLLSEIAVDLEQVGYQIFVVDPNHRFDRTDPSESLRFVEELDVALAGAEFTLLRAAGFDDMDQGVTLPECEIFRGLSGQQLNQVTSLMSERKFPAGKALCRVGDTADELFVLTEGSLDVLAAASSGHGTQGRIASLSPGTCVGEIALIDGRNRSADVVAGRDSTCHVLTTDAFVSIASDFPAVHAILLRNILLMNLDRLRVSGSTFADRRD